MPDPETRRSWRDGEVARRLVLALASPTVPASPEWARGTGSTLVIDAVFVGAADDAVGDDNRLGSGLGDERQHLFRDSVILADVGRPLRKPASKLGCLGALSTQDAYRELGCDRIVGAI